MDEQKYNKWSGECIYNPPKNDDKPKDCTLAVKFCTDILLLESFLKQQKIEYTQEDLEDTAMGKAIRIKR